MNRLCLLLVLLLPVSSVPADPAASGAGEPGAQRIVAVEESATAEALRSTELTAEKSPNSARPASRDADDKEGFVLIPGGTNTGPDPDYPGTYYTVTVESFYMRKTEVSLGRWIAVLVWALENGYDLPLGQGKGMDHPVHSLSWYDCVKWCNAISEMEGRDCCYKVGGAVYRAGEPYDPWSVSCDFEASGYRLPTAHEQLYAAHGGLSGMRFPWGNTISHSQANYSSSSYISFDVSPTRGYHPDYDDGAKPYTSPVGSFAANGYGLYDMAGNVEEYGWDSYSTAETRESQCILHGGDWSHNAYACRTNLWTVGLDPDRGNYTEGFRLCSASPAPARYHRVEFSLGVGHGSWSGGGLPIQSVADGTAAFAPEVVASPGLTFLGWDTDFSVVTQPLVVTAQYRVNSYTLAFDSAGGSGIDPLTQYYGTPVAAPEDPTRLGYTFAGWNPPLPETMPAGNLTLVAQWTINRYTVTFRPGDHGSLVGGTPNVTVQVDYGNPMPDAPVVSPQEGWQLGGWEWASPRRYTVPATITQDWTATAFYMDAGLEWHVVLTVDGTVSQTLTFGMHGAATDGWDKGVDSLGSPTRPDGAFLTGADFSVAYAADYRAPAETAECLFVVSAGDVPVTATWETWGLSGDKCLSLYEVWIDDLEGQIDELGAREGPVARAPVGRTALDMDDAESLVVPAGETRCYVIRYGDELVYDMPLAVGWNLVSLPYEPVAPAVESVLNDGTRDPVYQGAVLRWQGAAYVETNEMHACTGYWVYAQDAAVLLVRGARFEQTALDLLDGWNLLGVNRACSLSGDARIQGTAWFWSAETLRYSATENLRPGLGYWIRVTESTSIMLDGDR